jgi:uncharacterized membrane protein (DUF106 family)
MGFIPIPNYGLTGGTEAIILVIAVAYAILTILFQRKITNVKRMREIQARISRVSAEMKELTKRNASQQELMSKQKEIMPLMGESMRSSIKPMLVILPIFLLMYYVLLPNLPISAGNPKGVQGFFFMVVFIVGIVLAAALMIIDRRATKAVEKELASNGNAGPQPVSVK